MKVIIVRHAQTNENANEIQIGQEAEALLNEEGVKQAQKLAEHLKSENIAIAYVSPQHRAMHTAKEALKHHPGAKIVPAEHLKEQHLGIYEGKGKAEWKAIKKLSKEPFHLFKPEKGESYLELQQRVAAFFNGLLEKHANETVVLVSHAGTLGMLYLHLLGKEITEEHYKAHKPENTAVSIIEVFQDKPIVVHALNNIDHLT